ncbi:hypothetical protein [Chimaeribacter coloradensis]|uniref:hypothetical protein n=1 Tax=Chimaeribacter coloradensis TaxID=2060068 RepID=UPI0019D44D58|nr:hypothetical protein [Chimaeribacter coloradensis]
MNQRHNYEYVAGWIALEVHSSLSAAGLAAAFSAALAWIGISWNAVAGFIFVTIETPMRATKAIRTLRVGCHPGLACRAQTLSECPDLSGRKNSLK